MSFSDRIRFRRAVEESTPREVVGKHPMAEPLSDPPISRAAIRPPPRIDAPRALRKHAEFWDSVKKIGVGIIFAAGVITGAFTWGVRSVVRNELETFKARLDPIVVLPEPVAGVPKPPTLSETLAKQFGEVKTDNAKTDQKVTDLQTENDRRWNNLDRILQKNFGSDTSTPAPPAYGSIARSHGKAPSP